MTRSTSGATLLRRRRASRPGRVAEAHETHEAARTEGLSATPRRRRLDVPQDQATYSCSCGYVFAAAVSTSVGCPNCGTEQAW